MQVAAVQEQGSGRRRAEDVGHRPSVHGPVAERQGIPAIADRTPRLAADLRNLLAGLKNVRTLDRGPQLGALVTCEIKGWEPLPFKKALDAAGVNSALSFREFAQYDFGVDKDVDWAIRLSPHYYNTAAEVDTVVDVIRELAK